MSEKKSEQESIELSILEPYRPLVIKVVSRRVPANYVEDVVQETFRRAVASLSSLKHREALSSWLVKIASRTVSDFHSKKSKVSELSAGTETTEFITTPQATDEFQYSYNKLMYKEIVRLLMEKLDPEDQKMIQLFYFDELPSKQVSERLGVSERNIRVRLHRLRERMRKLMAQHHASVELFGVQPSELSDSADDVN